MAGDWIKLRKCLFTHPKVIRIASATGICEETVVGWLAKVWAWADDATVDGNVDCVTANDVVRVTGVPVKLLAAMQSVGWLLQTAEGIAFPDYESHMGNCAKKRAMTQKRVKKHRSEAREVDSGECNAGGVTEELPEKRREEKRKSPRRSPRTSPLFEDFWQAYPRRNGVRKEKAKAADEFAKLDEPGQRDAIQAAIDYGNSGELPKDAFRWLRGDWREWLEGDAYKPPEQQPATPRFNEQAIFGE